MSTAVTTPRSKTKSPKQAAVHSDIDRIFDAQMSNRFKMATSTSKERIQRLKMLRDWIFQNKTLIHEALYQDFKKPVAEVDLSEILVVTAEIKHAIRHLRRWMKPKRVRPTLAMMSTRSRIHYEARGVVLIIAPWNYPFNLAIAPLVSALAAGNCAVIKPSEATPNTSALIKQMVSELFPENEVAVVEGAVPETQALLAKPFHHIFFTGSPGVGKIIMKAAAEHLASVTMELGGKCPLIVDKSANLSDAAEKIIWGKYTNVGQTCIAPDYLLVHESIESKLRQLLKTQIDKTYGENSQQREANPDYARVINGNHFQRLKTLLDNSLEAGAKVEIGGHYSVDENYIEPTILSGISEDSPAMQEEIFGPILPIITYGDINEALDIINHGEKPLALYLFSKNRALTKKVLANTFAGTTCINEVVVHFMHNNIPFGGVNNSGLGKSHGYYGFLAFSNERPVLKHNSMSALKLLFPPYTKGVQRLINLVVKYL